MLDRVPQDNRLRRAINACLPGLEDHPSFEQDVLRYVRGEKKMKKKLSVGLVLAIAFVLMFAAAAGAVTLNLFEKYGQKDRRLLKAADQTAVVPTSVAIPNGALGESTVSITNAYYDGSALLLGYTIENPVYFAKFVPTSEQLKKMEKTSEVFQLDPSNEAERTLADEYSKAQENGIPFGTVRFQVYLSPDACTEKGVNLGTWTEFNELSEQGLYVAIRDFDDLPQEGRNLEHLSVSTEIYQNCSYYYFDGKDSYILQEEKMLSSITASIPCTSKAVCRYSGTANQDGSEMVCSVDATNMRLIAKVSGSNLKAELPDGCSYDMCLKDVEGSLLEASSFEVQEDGTLVFTFHGTGSLPPLQAANLLLVGDDGTTAIHFDMVKETE